MTFDLDTELTCFYERWLMENFPDEVRNKDRLVELSERGHRIQEFLNEVKKWFGEK